MVTITMNFTIILILLEYQVLQVKNILEQVCIKSVKTLLKVFI